VHRPPLAEASRALVGKSSAAPLTFGLSGAALLVAVCIAGFSVAPRDWLLPMGAIGLVALTTSMLAARSYQSQLRGRTVGAFTAAPLIVLGALAAYVVPSASAAGLVLAFALALILLALRAARWAGHPGQLRNMQDFRAARAFFRRRLRQSATSIDEIWIPYLLAFGLGKDLDRWSVAAPGPPRTSPDRLDDDRSFTPSTGFPSESSGGGFRPGGGAFGGAGASGYWASSINSCAASVPAPRAESSSSSSDSSSYSSSDSSSSSSGGSDSGGGSGGGW
jgi:uncharacterized membrane protein YgcG